MKQYLYIVLATFLVCLTACQDDDTQDQTPTEFCAACPWTNGRATAATRTLSDDIFGTTAQNDIVIANYGYPSVIDVQCIEDPKTFQLTTSEPKYCTVHTNYVTYQPSITYRDLQLLNGLHFTATAVIDGEDELYAEKEDFELNGGHLLLNLHHKKALIRFAFQLDEDYAQIRQIRLSKVVLNDTECHLHTHPLLTKDKMQVFAYLYADPELFSTTAQMTMTCTYDVLDRDYDPEHPDPEDPNGDSHITRKGVTATNRFSFTNLNVTKLLRGYYYDLYITINPDYLYVLSEHDNKQHLKVE